MPIFESSVVLIDENAFLITGGFQNKLVNLVSSACFQFDTLTFKLKKKQNMTVPRFEHKLCKVDNFVYVFGGRAKNSFVLRSCERYSLLQNEWQQIPPLVSEK